MALLCGETDNEECFMQLVSYMLNLEKTRDKVEWLQVYPATLYSKIEAGLVPNLIKINPDEPYEGLSVQEEDKKVLEYQRINFVFDKERYLAFKSSMPHHDHKIICTSETFFEQMDGSVVPKNFWNNCNDFIKNGIGFTLLDNDFPVSTAFSSFIIDNQLEIGVETSNNQRGSGLASVVCAELINYCLANGYEPVWSCNSGNIGSRKLAHKLGFVEIKRVPYYRLPK